MAGWLDWMSNDIGGSQMAQGPMPNGTAGVPMGNTGVTWNDLTKAAMAYGSKPGSSGPMIGGFIQPMNQRKQQSSTGAIANILLNAFMG